MIGTIDEVRAWKDEDYREELGLDGSEHPAGLIDLSPISPDANQYPTASFDALCLSIINNCFTSWPYICTTVNCYTELADSRD